MKRVLIMALLSLVGNYTYGQELVNEYLAGLNIDSGKLKIKLKDEDKFWHSYPLKTKVLRRPLFGIFKGLGRPWIIPPVVAIDTIRRYLLLTDATNFLNQPLIHNGVEVTKETNKLANGRIGVATCRENKIKIILPTKIDTRLSLEGLAFFIEHEFAHIRLGHASCSTIVNIKSRIEMEKDADIEAVRSLLSKLGGEIIVNNALGVLYALNLPRTPSHPSSDERVSFIKATLGRYRGKVF